MELLQVRAVGPTPADVLVLALSGDLDYDTQQTLREMARDALDDDCRLLIVECSGLTFCDSEGLNALLQLHQDAEHRGVALVVVALSSPMRHVLELTDALQVFVRTDTVEQALHATGGTGAPAGGAAHDFPFTTARARCAGGSCGQGEETCPRDIAPVCR